MTDRELFELALNSLTSWPFDTEENSEKRMAVVAAIRARLERPPKDFELPLVRAEEFVKMIEGKEGFRGIPVFRTEWPTPEEI